MNEENNTNNGEDLNDADFEQLFFNGQPVEQEVEEPQEEVENQEEVEEDSGDDEVDSPATEEDEDEDEPEEDEKPAKGKNRKSAQERINELTAKARAEEREKIAAEQREAALIRRLEELEAAVNKETETKTVRDQLPDGAPNPDAKDENGDPIYELGEFDPKFIRDLTKFTITEETKAAKKAAEQEAQMRAMQEAQEQLQAGWLEKLEKYEEEAPEVREDLTGLVNAFGGLDVAYGEYLASTIMASEVGPQLMHYLSQNIGEAQKIVASGPAAATLALGRLEAKLMKSTEVENTGNKKRVSDAPAPPEERARGIKGQFAVRPDTDDQRAFEREFFKKD